MTQLEFYKSFQFVAELLVAEFLFVFRLRRRSLSPLRIILGIALCFLFSWLFPVFPVIENNAYYCSFMFLMIFIFTVLICRGIFKETWLTVVFCCIAGYTTQHLSYQLYTLVLYLMNANSTSKGFYGAEYTGLFSNLLLTAVYFSVYILTYFVVFLFFGNKLEKNESVRLKTTFIFLLGILILMVDIILNAIIIYNLSSGEKLYMITVGIYNILCCIIVLYLQFEVALRRRLETTLDTVQHLWHQTKEQYAISKENIALINMKCHDLKHQIHYLGSSNMVSSAVLKEIEDQISIYDSAVKTNNDALDIILTEKSLLCNKNGVKLNCIADGQKLNFMAEADIYALFGNIIDNAIEAVLKLEPSKRIISLHVKIVENILVIRAYNYYGENILFENGIPQTTKDDKKYHGFGIKSIQYICEKYGGDLSVTTDNDVFIINILFFPTENRVF